MRKSFISLFFFKIEYFISSNNTFIMNCQFLKSNNELCKFKAITDSQFCKRHHNTIKKKMQNETSEHQNETNIKQNETTVFNETIDYSQLECIDNQLNFYLHKDTKKVYKILEYETKNVLENEIMVLKNKFNNSSNNNIIKYNNYINRKNKYSILEIEYNLIKYSFADIKNKKELLTNDFINNIGYKLINTIKYIHSKKLLYLKLTPNLIRFNDNYEPVLCDLHNTIQYVNNNSEFYLNYKLVDRHNNDIYGSRNINLGYRGVRIDDLESILYVLLDLVSDNDIMKMKDYKQIKRIINLKNKILTNTYNIEVIDYLITKINKYVIFDKIDMNMSNRLINYQ